MVTAKGRVQDLYSSDSWMKWILALVFKFLLEAVPGIILALLIARVALFGLTLLNFDAANPSLIGLLSTGAIVPMIWDSYIEPGASVGESETTEAASDAVESSVE